MNSLTMQPASVLPDAALKKSSARYLSLDVLRGLTIALMVVVNNPGSWANIYAPFEHAAWHGFTPTDLVFPTFLFVVGNAMSFSMRKFENQPDSVFLKKVFKRTALIFISSLLLYAYPLVTRNADGDFIWKDFTSIRIMGVLQRIAVCYCLASLAIRYLRKKAVIILSLALLLGYWAVMYYFGDAGDPYSLEGNAALKFDLLFFRPENLYHGFGIPFDPEGLLSCVPAIVNVIAGYLAGKFIQANGSNKNTIVKLIAYGIVLLLVARIWNIWFPINKPIWTSSYVLYSTGFDLLILAALLWIIELSGYKKWTYFFEVFGKNPLFIFIMSAVVVKTLAIIQVGGKGLHGWIYDNLFLSWAEGKNASLLYAFAFMLVMWLLAFWMDKKKIYVKI